MVSCGGLVMIEYGPQVEEEARYEPVRHLRQHERACAKNKSGHLRRLHTPFRIRGNIHPRHGKCGHEHCSPAANYGLQTAPFEDIQGYLG